MKLAPPLMHLEQPVQVVRQQGPCLVQLVGLDQLHPEEPVEVVRMQERGLGEDLEAVDMGSL